MRTTKTVPNWRDHCWKAVKRLRSRGEHRRADAIAVVLLRYEMRYLRGVRR